MTVLTIAADSLVPNTGMFLYRVCTGGDYDPSALLLCYRDGDSNKVGVVNYQANLIATGTTLDGMIQPNVQGFEDALWKDTNLPDAIKLGLVTLFPLIEKYIGNGNYTALQSGWTTLVNVNHNTWLNPTIQNIILQHALDNGIPLI